MTDMQRMEGIRNILDNTPFGLPKDDIVWLVARFDALQADKLALEIGLINARNILIEIGEWGNTAKCYNDILVKRGSPIESQEAGA